MFDRIRIPSLKDNDCCHNVTATVYKYTTASRLLRGFGSVSLKYEYCYKYNFTSLIY